MRTLPFHRLFGVVSTAIFSLAVIAFFPCGGWAAPHPRFHITDLGPASLGVGWNAMALNNHGDVVGININSNNTLRPALFRNGTVTELPIPPDAGGGHSFDINDAGDIIGHYYSFTTPGYHPFLIRAGQLIDLNAQTGLDLELAGINESGVIAARSYHGLTSEVVTWSNGVVRTFGHLTYGYPMDINNHGDILVRYYTEEPPGPGTISAVIRDDALFTLGVFEAWTFNDRGEAAGELNYVAFLYAPGGSRSIGALPDDLYSQALKMNNAGQIIGASEDPNDRLRPFFYSGRRMYDFTQVIPRRSGYTVLAVGDINERGQIAARGSFRGEARTLLLTPARQ